MSKDFTGLPNELRDAAEATDGWWFDGVTRAIENLAASGRTFTSLDVAEMVGEPERPSQWGPPFAWARRRGLIEPIGAMGSARPSRHRALVRVWAGVNQKDADAA